MNCSEKSKNEIKNERNEIKIKKKDGGVEAPISLFDFFNNKEENLNKNEENNENQFEQIYDEQRIEIFGERVFIIRQYCWHMANANKIWPGTFNLAEFITLHSNRFINSNILELGAATGALSIYLQSTFLNYNLITSDIDDGGEVENNIIYNFQRNGNFIFIFLYYNFIVRLKFN